MAKFWTVSLYEAASLVEVVNVRLAGLEVTTVARSFFRILLENGAVENDRNAFRPTAALTDLSAMPVVAARVDVVEDPRSASWMALRTAPSNVSSA